METRAPVSQNTYSRCSVGGVLRQAWIDKVRYVRNNKALLLWSDEHVKRRSQTPALHNVFTWCLVCLQVCVGASPWHNLLIRERESLPGCFFFLFFKKTEWKEGLSSLYTFQHNCRLQSNLQDVMSQRVVEGDFPPQSQQQKVLSHRRLATSTGLTGELQSVQRTYTVQTILYT